ncbi:MAG: putative glycoside hydrolase [Oscillospiraceae bacterium]
MLNNRKIKHYRKMNDYKSSAGITPFKIVISVVLLCVLIFIGWSAYTPIYNLVMQFTKNEVVKVDKIEDISDSSAVDTEDVNTSQSSTENEVKPNDDIIAADTLEIKALYMPLDILSNPQKTQTFVNNTIKNHSNINTIMIDIKGQDGIINIPTSNQIAIKSEAINKNSQIIAESIKIIKDSNIKIMGRISAFKDPLSPFNIPSAQIKYMNTDYAWIDKSPEKGGKQWLNPYANEATEYILDIANNSIKLGVNFILFDNVQFPTGEALEKATYGNISIGKSRSFALKSFMDKAINKIGNLKNKCFFYSTTYNAFNPNDLIYGGNQLDLSKENITISLMLTQFADVMFFNGTSYPNNQNEPDKSIDAMLTNIDNMIDNKSSMALLQSFKFYGEAMSSDEITKQINVLDKHNIKNYILYNPNGIYN